MFKQYCKNPKTGKTHPKTLFGFINSNYLYAVKKSKNGIDLLIGYKTKDQKSFLVEGLVSGFLKILQLDIIIIQSLKVTWKKHCQWELMVIKTIIQIINVY